MVPSLPRAAGGLPFLGTIAWPIVARSAPRPRESPDAAATPRQTRASGPWCAPLAMLHRMQREPP
jgi:hypothetical protein